MQIKSYFRFLNLIILGVFTLFLFDGCSSKKETAELNPPPAWVSQKPVIPGYYVGIGGTRKIGTSPEYTAQARKEALADLVGDISSRISTSSVLHTIETEAGLSDSFEQRIEIETEDYVEGFEPVDLYETETMYWVYYRIEKTVYHQRKAQKKKEAVTAALNKLSSGDSFLSNDRPLEALPPYLQGLAALKYYLGEATEANYQGTQVDVGSQLYQRIQTIHKNLNITANTKEATYKAGAIVSTPLQFVVTYKGAPQVQVPVQFHYTGGYLSNDKGNSDVEGKVSCILGKINGQPHNILTAKVNWQALLNKSTDDLQIRGLLKGFSSIQAATKIEISKPSIALQLDTDLCKTVNCTTIKRKFEAYAQAKKLKLATDADFQLQVQVNYSPGPSTEQITSVYIEGNYILKDRQGQVIKSVRARQIRGVGKNTKEAKTKALRTFLDEAVDRYWPTLIDKIY